MAEEDRRLARPRLWLHLGWDSATGALLQRMFDRCSADLRRAGILYPATGRTTDFPERHDALARAFAGGQPATAPASSDALAALATEFAASGAHSMVLSSPAFASLSEEQIGQVADHFDEVDISPVLVLRNFTDWLSSRYGERVLTRPVTTHPNAGAFAGRMLARLAAWGAVAHDGSVQVVDADGSDAEATARNVIEIMGLEAVLPDPSATAAAVDQRHLVAAAAIVREFRALGVAEADLAPLPSQLAGVPFTEHLTNVAAPDAAVLDQRYAAFHERLRTAPFARWRHSPVPPAERIERMHINGAAAAVFAIGRAISP